MGEAQRAYWRRRRALRAQQEDRSITVTEASLLAQPGCRSGENNGNAKLTAGQVAAIKAALAAGLTVARLAQQKLYPVSETTLYRIKRGEAW